MDETTDTEANELRLVANEIMRRLYTAGKRDQLTLLSWYVEGALKDI